MGDKKLAPPINEHNRHNPDLAREIRSAVFSGLMLQEIILDHHDLLLPDAIEQRQAREQEILSSLENVSLNELSDDDIIGLSRTDPAYLNNLALKARHELASMATEIDELQAKKDTLEERYTQIWLQIHSISKVSVEYKDLMSEQDLVWARIKTVEAEFNNRWSIRHHAREKRALASRELSLWMSGFRG